MASTADLNPISEYVLIVHAPTKWDTSEWKEKGTFRSSSPSMFTKASTPFPVPQVGHEICVVINHEKWLGSEEPSPEVFVVTRVIHRVVSLEGAITHSLEVFTRAAPYPEGDLPDELKTPPARP